MLRLGIELVTDPLMPARMIPKAMLAILKAAGLDSKTDIQIPTKHFFFAENFLCKCSTTIFCLIHVHSIECNYYITAFAFIEIHLD